MAKYDFVIVGAGFAGASCARLLTDKGYKCLVVEERPFVCGNCLTDKQNDIDIHFLGPHILHTNNDHVWDFLTTYGDIHQYNYMEYSWYNGKIYPIPYSMNLLSMLYEKAWPYECDMALSEDLIKNTDQSNIENYCLANFGKEVYEKTIKGYYEKKFNCHCSEISTASLEEKINDKELIFINSFFREKYQGVPENGYVNLVENMLGDDIDVLLKTNFLADKNKFLNLCDYLIYTGPIDKLFNYCMGNMDWGSIHFEFTNESDKTTNLSGTPIVRFCDSTANWYRMTEHKWLTPWRKGQGTEFDNTTFITYEFFKEWKQGDECFFPIFNNRSINLHERYVKKLKEHYPKIIPCGSKAEFKDYSICETIESAMRLVDKFPDKN